VKTVDVPDPKSVTVEGLLVIVHESEGNPDKSTLPVVKPQIGWVIFPITGADCAARMVTGVVTCSEGQPPEAGIVYLTVYERTLLVLGVIAPVAGLIVNPLLLAEKTPPVYAPVPVRVTG
jgi:hypothetical protein